MLEHLEKSGGLGAIWPAIINSIFAMKCLGYSDDHPALVSQLREVEKLVVYEEDKLLFTALRISRLGYCLGNYCASRIRHTKHTSSVTKGRRVARQQGSQEFR